MEFKVNSTDFEKLLTKIIPAVPTRTPMPILENFLFEIKESELTVFATDMEISLRSSMAIVADDETRLVVPARLIYDIVRSLKDTSINFNIEGDGRLTLHTDNGEYKISYIDPEEYPSMPSFPPEEEDEEEIREINLQGESLKLALEKTAFAMSKEEMRPAMMGTLLEIDEDGIRFVTTDGHRLVNFLYKGAEIDFTDQYIVPEKAISVLTKLLGEEEVKVYLSKTHISFSLDDIELITRLIGHKYPDYRSVIPLENEFMMKVKTRDLHNAIKRMMLFSTSQTKRVKFSVAENQLVISAEDIDQGTFGKETLFCEYNDESLEIGFNSAYVNDILNHLNDEEEINFKLHSPNKAVIVEPVKEKEDIDLMMLLMPVRLNN